MMLIDTSDRDRWEKVEKNHKEWWIKHLETIDIKEEIKNIPDKELKFLLFILNKYKRFSTVTFRNKIKTEKIIEILPNIEICIINRTIRKKSKLINNIWKSLIKKEELQDGYLNFLKDHILKEITLESLKGKTWNSHLKKMSKEELEFTFYLLKNNDLTDEEKENIKNIKNKEDVVSLIDKLTLNEVYLKKNIMEKKRVINPNSNYENKINYIRGEETKIEKLINQIFDYDKYKIRHKTIADMNVTTCPYCGRQYTTNYSNNEKTTADLDHYFPKSKYPYLALSLYNFIPSCLYCNRIKGNQDGHLYPYEEEFGNNAIFKTSNESINGILNSNKDDFKVIIKVEDKNNYSIKESKGIFNLDEVYKTSHNKYILDMLHTIEHYPDSYLETIAEIFGKKEEIGKKEELKKELRSLLKKPYEDRIERNDTLAKLTKDILNEYKSL